MEYRTVRDHLLSIGFEEGATIEYRKQEVGKGNRMDGEFRRFRRGDDIVMVDTKDLHGYQIIDPMELK